MKCTSINDPIVIKFCNGFKWYPVELTTTGGDKSDDRSNEVESQMKSQTYQCNLEDRW